MTKSAVFTFIKAKKSHNNSSNDTFSEHNLTEGKMKKLVKLEKMTAKDSKKRLKSSVGQKLESVPSFSLSELNRLNLEVKQNIPISDCHQVL